MYEILPVDNGGPTTRAEPIEMSPPHPPSSMLESRYLNGGVLVVVRKNCQSTLKLGEWGGTEQKCLPGQPNNFRLDQSMSTGRISYFHRIVAMLASDDMRKLGGFGHVGVLVAMCKLGEVGGFGRSPIWAHGLLTVCTTVCSQFALQCALQFALQFALRFSY